MNKIDFRKEIKKQMKVNIQNIINKKRPEWYELDELSRYLGFDDFSDFCQNGLYHNDTHSLELSAKEENEINIECLQEKAKNLFEKNKS